MHHSDLLLHSCRADLTWQCAASLVDVAVDGAFQQHRRGAGRIGLDVQLDLRTGYGGATDEPFRLNLIASPEILHIENASIDLTQMLHNFCDSQQIY